MLSEEIQKEYAHRRYMMYLHNDVEKFREILQAASESLSIEMDIVEKDYYAYLLLRALHEENSLFVFRGGTSLSKCYHAIHRFSEDIDLSVHADHLTQLQREGIEEAIKQALANLNLPLLNGEGTRSRQEFNRYETCFDSVLPLQAVSSNIAIKTFVPINPFPVATHEVGSYVGKFLSEEGHAEILQSYSLQPFGMLVQEIERTFVDKVFALCDYYLAHDVAKHSRHIYDIAQILPVVQKKDKREIRRLIAEVRQVREVLPKCISARFGVDITETLQKIVDEEVFRKDYEKLTIPLLCEPVPYNKAVEALQTIIDERLFDKF